MLEHGIHAGRESEVDDVDAMMHDLYCEGSACQHMLPANASISMIDSF